MKIFMKMLFVLIVLWSAQEVDPQMSRDESRIETNPSAIFEVPVPEI